MLDMLGLVRRDGEDEEDSSDGLLIPADQQQQLLSKSIDRDNENNPKASGKTAPPNSVPNAMDDFNTQLSLDDLAPPQSVAPPELDRTPQLSDEYQVIILENSHLFWFGLFLYTFYTPNEISNENNFYIFYSF